MSNQTQTTDKMKTVVDPYPLIDGTPSRTSPLSSLGKILISNGGPIHATHRLGRKRTDQRPTKKNLRTKKGS